VAHFFSQWMASTTLAANTRYARYDKGTTEAIN